MIKRFLWKILTIPLCIIILDLMSPIFNFSATLIRLDNIDFGFPWWLDVLIDSFAGMIAWLFIQSISSLSQNSKENVTNILAIIIGVVIGIVVHILLKFWIFITIILSGLLLTAIVICVRNYIKNKKEKSMILGYENIEDETVMEIGKFTILWNMFERDCHCKATRYNIKIFVSQIKEDYDKKIFDEFIHQIKNRADAISCPINEYVDKKLYPTEDDEADVSDREISEEIPIVKNFIDENSRSNLCGAVFAIKRIRNNMFHGLKENYYKEFFQAINNVLEYLLSLNIKIGE